MLVKSTLYKHRSARLGGFGTFCLIAAHSAWSSTFGPPVALVPSDAQPLDSFGYSVAVDSQFAVVGSVLHDQDEQDAGTAYVFNTTTGAELFELRPSTPTAGAQFGFSVDVSGNLAVVGSPFEGDGAAYVYDLTTGQEVHKFVGNNTFFGQSVAIDGNYAIVGSSFFFELDTSGGGFSITSGAAYLYDLTTGNEVRRYTVPGNGGGSGFGTSVDIEGSNILVGAPSTTNANGSMKGSAYLFDTGSDAVLQELISPDTSIESFGSSVALDGGVAAVRNHDSNAIPNDPDAEPVELFDTVTGTHLLSIGVDGQFFGGLTKSVDAANGVVVAGQNGFFDTGGLIRPSEVFTYDSASGGLIQELGPDDINEPSIFDLGIALGLSEDYFIAGAPAASLNGTNSGAAYLFPVGQAQLPGDADGDGDIDDTDLGIAISNFTGPVGAAGNKSFGQGDTDGDGDVDDTDLGVAISGFTGPLSPANVPEPASVALLAFGGLLASRRRRCA